MALVLLGGAAGCGSTVKPSTTPVPQAVTPTPPAERETRGAKIAKAEETSRENDRHDAEIIEQATLTPAKTPKVGPPKPAEERVEGETIPEEMAKAEKHARESAEYNAYLLAQKTLEEETTPTTPGTKAHENCEPPKPCPEVEKGMKEEIRAAGGLAKWQKLQQQRQKEHP